MTDDPMGDRSIEGRAANGEGDDAPELFPLGSLEGDGVTLKTIVKPSEKVETTVAMMSAEVPSSGGLLDPRREGMLLVTYELAQAPLVPKREGDRARGKQIVGWKIRQQVRPIFVEQVSGEAGALEANFAALLAEDPAKAGALLDRMRERAEAALQPA
jgi:hypothetical protein